MRYIDIKINDNYIQNIEYKELIGGSYKNDFCRFLFDKEWEEFKDKFAVFVTENGSYKKAIIDNECDIPSEICNEKCKFGIGVYGILVAGQDNLIKRNSTNLVYVRCHEGAYKEDLKETEAVENESIYELYISKMNEIYSKIKQEHKDIIEGIDDKEIAVKRDIDEYAIEKVNEYNENVIAETDKFNTNADNRKKEIDTVALNVEEDKKAVENIQEDIINRQEAVKSSENNAKTSEQNAQDSANKALESESNITAVQQDINASKTHIDEQKGKVDKSVDDVEKLVEEATIQANISKEQAELSTTKAGQVSADKNAVESMKNEVSSMKKSVEQTKADAEQIKEETEQAKNETLEAKTEVENSLENERIESDKKYARAIDSEEIVIDGSGQVELDEDGYMKELYAEANLPDITQENRLGYNLLKTSAKTNTQNGVDYIVNENGSVNLNGEASEIIWINLNPNFNFETDDYTAFINENTINGVSLYSDAIGFCENIKTFNISEDISKSVLIKINKGTILNDVTVYPMILKGTYTKENIPEFESYGLSPSLEFPSEFQNVVKNVEMKLLKNNLSNFTTESTGAILGTSWVGLDFEIINNYTSKISGKPTVDEYRVGGPYNSTNVLIVIDHKKKYYIYNNLNLRMGVTLVQKDGTYRQLSLDNKELLSLTENDIGISSLRISVNTKIEYKNTILRYIVCEAIEENELALSEGQFLGNFKGYKNYIKDNKLLKSLVKVKLNGTEDWELKNVKEKTQVFFWNLQKKIVPNIGFCNYLKFNAPGDVEKYTPVEGGIYIAINKSTASTVEELKNLLSSLYNSGNAMTFIYAIPTPEKEELSTEIKSKINSLKVYNGINNIYSNCKISFKANKNLNNYIKNKIDKSMAENNKTERKTSDNKYSKALKDKIVDKSFVQVYADNPKTDNLAIKGEQLKQRVRQGYNLLKYPYVSTNKTQHGVAITDNGDGSITLNGTSTEEIRFGYQWENNLPNDYYTYITYGLPDTCYTNYFNIGDIYGQRVANFDKTATTETVNLGAQLVIPKGVTLNNITIYPMLVKGQYTRETIPVWEQYGASPSFEFPSEIKETSEQNIEVCKKNLAHTNNVSTDNGYINTTNAKIGKVKANKEHIISFNCSSEYEGTNQIQSRNIYLDKTYEVLGNIKFSSGNRVSLVFTPQYDGEVYLSANFGIAYENILSGIQIEYGNIATEFEPYEGNEYNAVLPEGQFNGAIGEYSDKIYAAGKQDKVIQRLVLDGTENISTSSNGNIFRFRPEIEPIVNNTSGLKTNAIMSNAFSNMSFDNLYNANVENGIEIYNGLIQFRDSTINSVDDCKTKFKELYDAGTPVIIYYVTNAVSVDLPEGTVPKIELMDGLNNISIDKGTMSFEYNKSLARAFEEEREEKEDLKTRVSNLENQILELLGGN